jgi:hypothetical protein
VFALNSIAVRLAGAVAVLALLAGAGVWLHARWVDEGKAIVQVQLDKANRDIGVLTAANVTNEATIRALEADERANEQIIENYAARVTALNQQADDTASAIRKLQADDQTVANYLRTPIPAALRGVLNHRRPAEPVGAANEDGGPPAAGATRAAVPGAP